MDCECRGSLLDLWLPVAVAEEFMKRIQSLLGEQGLRPEVTGNYSSYRFIVPPFAAFISIPCELGISKQDMCVDLEQFVGNREETAITLAKKLISTPFKGQDLQFYIQADGADLPTDKPISLMINPRLRGQEANRMEEMLFVSVSLADCYYTVDCYNDLMRKRPLSFYMPERRKKGIFALDEACASLTLTMKETLRNIQKDIWKPAIFALERCFSTSTSLNSAFSPTPPTGNFSSTYPAGQLQSYQSSISSDIKSLETLLSQLQAEDSALPVCEQFHLLAERSEAGKQEIHIVNSTANAYQRVELWLLDSQGARISKVEIAGIQPFRNGAVMYEAQIEEMKALGGAFLQLANGNELSLPH